MYWKLIQGVIDTYYILLEENIYYLKKKLPTCGQSLM